MQPSEKIETYHNKQQSYEQVADLLCLHNSPFVRTIYLAGGFLALLLGAIGVVLPILPTTPFLLLAGACFARGSEHFHRKLLTNRIAGPIILEWHIHRSIPRPIKRGIYWLVTLSFGISILVVPELWLKLMLVVIGSILIFFIWRVPVRNTV